MVSWVYCTVFLTLTKDCWGQCPSVGPAALGTQTGGLLGPGEWCEGVVWRDYGAHAHLPEHTSSDIESMAGENQDFWILNLDLDLGLS